MLTAEALTKAAEQAGVVVHSARYARAIRQAYVFARFGWPVLIYGETGAGKDVLARVVAKALGIEKIVVQACGAIPETLGHSELFGYAPNSFTGASSHGRPGLLENSNGGALVLDEIEELSPLLQASLLEVLESGRYRKIGSTAWQRFSATVFATVNRDPEALIEAGKLRRDFYERFLGRVYVAPLRVRRDDIRPLAELFLTQLQDRSSLSITFDDSAWKRILRRDYVKGNARELRRLIVEAVGVAIEEADSDNITVRASHVDRALELEEFAPGEAAATVEGLSLEELITMAIKGALRRNNFKQADAARELGISPRAMHYKLHQYGLWDWWRANATRVGLVDSTGV